MSEVPLWFTLALGLMLFGFGVFMGYAIAAYEDLRRSERELADIERRQDDRGWE